MTDRSYRMLQRTFPVTLLAAILLAAVHPAPAAKKEQRISTLDVILARQQTKGDVLNVYVKNETATYVNGKQLSLKTLESVVRKSRTQKAIVTTESDVSKERIKDVKESINNGGLQNIKVTELERDPAKARKEKLNEILARQEEKGDVLNVYLRDPTGTFVNGKQLSLSELESVVRKSDTKQAIITAEPEVTRERTSEVKDAISSGGLKSVKVTTRKED